MIDDPLGLTFRDVITGFEGVAIAHCRYITGCNQTLIAPRMVEENGKPIMPEWFDDQRLTHEERANRVTLDNGNTPGPDKPPSRQSPPPRR
jgi:hypothetical protein